MTLNELKDFPGAGRRRRRTRLAAMLLGLAALFGARMPALWGQGGGAPVGFPASPFGSPFQNDDPRRLQNGGQSVEQSVGLGQAAQGQQNIPMQTGQDLSRNQTEAEIAARQQREEAALSRASARAEEPTDFQRLVTATTNKSLRIFGSNLFDDVPSTFAPVSNIAVSPEYVLGPGDQLRINVFGQVSQTQTLTVSRTGDIVYPGVGTIHVAGLRYSQLESFLTSQLSRVYRNFQLNVNLGQLRSIQIFVFGQARRPGSYTVSSLSTLLNALFASGGPSPQGSLRDITVLRDKQTIAHFDLYDLLLRGDKSNDVPLTSGDVIFIPPVGAQVAITGSIQSPAIYEIHPGTTVAQLVALAGGKTSTALGAQVRLDRIFEHAERSVIDVDAARGDNPVLANGDIVTVAAILDRYKDAVTVRGNVAFPGRYVWHPGLKIMDLIPSKDYLVTREYYARRNALGNLGTVYQPLDAQGSLQVNGTSTTQQADRATLNGNTGGAQGGAGSSVGAALTGTNSVFQASTDVVLSAPDIDWNYAVVERLDAVTLTTSLLPFRPGALYLAGDTSQNVELQAGDVVTFFSTADLKVPTSQQTRFVRLEGEFFASGVYSVQPGETLRHLLARAGGFTPDAYLYGSEFTRQSTRRVQQQRLNEYADSLSAEISSYGAASAQRSVSDRTQAAVTAATTQGLESVARLRRVVPLGRIVLQLKPDSRGVQAVPDLPLEDGDRFVVPRVPSTISVEGQVYSANAFVFERGRRERDYLRQAGGPNRDADKKRSFILRADGSVFSRQYGNVDHASIFPGDTIVVPPQLERRAVLRNLLDLSSVVGQFGLGAAAVSVLR